MFNNKFINLRLFLRLARFHFLVPGFMLYVMGYLLALLSGVGLDLSKFIFGYLIFGSAHLSVSFSNDYFDRKADRDSVKTVFSGGSKVLVSHPEFESLALKTAITLIVVSIVANVFFTVIYAYSIWFFIFGLAGALLGWFYTAPPVKLAYRGLGELATMLAVGLLMPGMGYFVASGIIGPLFMIFILPLFCYGLFFITTVELPDLENDKRNNKKNFLVKWGRNTARYIYLTSTITGTFLITTLIFLETITPFNLTYWAIFSIIPLAASISAFLININNRKLLVRQVMINMTSMIMFIFLIDITLLLQYL